MERLKIKLFDYEKVDLVFFLFLAGFTLWLFAGGLAPGRIMLAFPDDIYTNSEYGYTLTFEKVPPFGVDTNLEYQPWNDYACERLKEGRIPFWNPYNFCGTPFFANSLNQLTYIPRIILSFLLPSENVLTVLSMLHFLLAGIGFYYFLKAYNVIPIAAGLAVLILLFKFNHPTILMMPPLAHSIAFMPICALIAVKLIRGGRWLFAGYLAVCISCVISSGYPVFSAHFFYFSIALIIFEYIWNNHAYPVNKRLGLFKILFACIFGTLLSLTQLIPLIQLLLLSARPPLIRDAAAHMYFNFTHLGMIVYQNILFPVNNLSSPMTYVQSFSNLYLGFVPFILGLPLFGQWRNKAYRFFFLAYMAFGLISFSAPLFHGAERFIPGFGLSPVPPVPAFFFCYIIAIALTINHIITFKYKKGIIQFIPIIIVGFTILIMPLFLRILRAEPEYFRINYMAFILTGLILLSVLYIRIYKQQVRIFTWTLIILLALNIISITKGFMTFYGPEHSFAVRCKYAGEVVSSLEKPRYFDATSTVYLASNINIYPRLRLVQGYDSLVLKHFADEYSKYIPKGVKRGRRLATGPGEAPDGLLRVTGTGKVIYNPVTDPIGISEEVNCIDLYTVDIDYPECTITDGQCVMHRIRPELIEVDIDTTVIVDLFVAETYYPGWRYRLDGKPEGYNVMQSDEGFMKIPDIPVGTSRVTLYYDPWLERLGLMLASTSFIIGVILVVLLDKKSRV